MIRRLISHRPAAGSSTLAPRIDDRDDGGSQRRHLCVHAVRPDASIKSRDMPVVCNVTNSGVEQVHCGGATRCNSGWCLTIGVLAYRRSFGFIGCLDFQPLHFVFQLDDSDSRRRTEFRICTIKQFRKPASIDPPRHAHRHERREPEQVADGEAKGHGSVFAIVWYNRGIKNFSILRKQFPNRRSFVIIDCDPEKRLLTE